MRGSMKDIEDKMIIHLVKNLEVSDLAGEKVMIDFDTGKYYMLKGVGNDIWGMLQEDIAFGDIIAKLVSEYEVDDITCRESVKEFLNHMQSNDFIIMK
jgi:hypothetical protein